MNWKKINHEKAQSVKKADAIIYQSRYSEKIYHKLVCKPDKLETVIWNGADPKEFITGKIERINKYHFLASTRVWLNQKRLKQIIRAFLEADISESRLFVCGDDQGTWKKYKNHKNVWFSKLSVHPRYLAFMYKLCDAMIHLTYVDACPNSVVEAQVAGCPVICTDQGGTKEILRMGTILRDKPFKYKPIDLDKPPKVDRGILIEAMKMATTWEFNKTAAKDLHIDNVAKRYLDFFERLL